MMVVLAACGAGSGKGSLGVPACTDWAEESPAPADISDGCEANGTIHLWLIKSCQDGTTLAYSNWGWGRTPEPFQAWGDQTQRTPSEDVLRSCATA